MKLNNIILAGMAAVLAVSCNDSSSTSQNSGNQDVEKPVETKDVVAYVSTAQRTELFKRSTFEFGKPQSMNVNKIGFSENPDSPEVDGFGLAVTTAAAYNLLQMTQEDRTAFLTELFDPKGNIGSSLIRVSIGASDFCLKDNYTWCDSKGLENFAVAEEDRTYLFPILKEIYAINPNVKIIGSPWSCPLWMKGGKWGYEGYEQDVLEQDYDNWKSGRLKPSCYDDYAEYFVKWIQVMEAEGFDIHAVTMQNEPLNHGNSISLYMPWKDQKEFIKVLGPELEKAGLSDVKILLFDHNYNYDNKDDQRNYPLNVYADAEAYKWAAGSAWHNYGGSVEELDNIRSANPEKDIYFSEASIGEWNYNFANCLLNDFSSIFLGTLSRGGKGVTLWNLMLDDKKGPFSPHDGSCKTCFGGVTINSSDYRTIERNSHWYNVAHASAVVKPGAKLMNIKGWEAPAGVECLMFKNVDGTIAALICNKSDNVQPMVFESSEYSVSFKAPKKSIASLIWKNK